MLNVTLHGDQELMARLKAMPDRVRGELVKTVTTLSLQLERHIKGDLLSGQVLHVRTGDLRASIHAVLPAERTSTGVYGAVAQSGDVKYGAIHEFGGQTSPHTIVPKNASVLAFQMGGKTVFARRVNHPGSKMPERSYMRRGLRDMKNDIISGLESAVKKGMKE